MVEAPEVRTLAPLSAAALAPIQDEGAQVMGLMQQAIERGVSVDALGKLVELQERVMRRRAELEFSQARAEFQNVCPPIPRSSKAKITTKSGTSFEYAYADFEQVVETVRPHLHARGFSFTFDSETDGKMLTCICHLRHANGHTIASRFALPTESASAMSEQQKYGAALSFAKRQSLVSVLGLALTDPEPEGGSVSEPITAEQAANLSALIAETGVVLTKFTHHFGVARLDVMRQNQYPEAVALLEARRKRVRS